MVCAAGKELEFPKSRQESRRPPVGKLVASLVIKQSTVFKKKILEKLKGMRFSPVEIKIKMKFKSRLLRVDPVNRKSYI